MKKGLTELVFILDRSGSMGGLEADTIGGFNAVLARHQALEGQAVVSTILFDHETLVLHDRLDIASVKPLTSDDYQVRGCTALLDAIGGAIRHVEKVHSYLPEEYRPEHVIFSITTDGLENASHKFTRDQVKAAIERKTGEGWEFIFMGANIDAVAEAGRLGIAEDRAVTYLADSAGTGAVYESMAEATCCMREAAPSAPRMSRAWKRSVEEDVAKRAQ